MCVCFAALQPFECAMCLFVLFTTNMGSIFKVDSQPKSFKCTMMTKYSSSPKCDRIQNVFCSRVFFRSSFSLKSYSWLTVSSTGSRENEALAHIITYITCFIGRSVGVKWLIFQNRENDRMNWKRDKCKQ